MADKDGFYAVKTHKNSFFILYNWFLFCNSFLLFVRYLHVDMKNMSLSLIYLYVS